MKYTSPPPPKYEFPSLNKQEKERVQTNAHTRAKTPSDADVCVCLYLSMEEINLRSKISSRVFQKHIQFMKSLRVCVSSRFFFCEKSARKFGNSPRSGGGWGGGILLNTWYAIFCCAYLYGGTRYLLYVLVCMCYKQKRLARPGWQSSFIVVGV